MTVPEISNLSQQLMEPISPGLACPDKGGAAVLDSDTTLDNLSATAHGKGRT